MDRWLDGSNDARTDITARDSNSKQISDFKISRSIHPYFSLNQEAEDLVGFGTLDYHAKPNNISTL